MTKKQVILITTVICVIIIVSIIGVSAFKNSKPAEQGSVTANQQSGVNQSGGQTASENTTPTQQDDTENTIPAKRTDPEILEVIIKQKTSLVGSDKQPLFTITRAQKTVNAWYVITVRHKNPTVGEAKIIMKDSGGNGGLVLIAGPGTYFDPAVIYLPNEVRDLL